jgi:hypothetical protein
LKGVIDVLLVAQDLRANRADKSAITINDRGEGVFVAVENISVQELGVCPESRFGPARQPPKVANDCI